MPGEAPLGARRPRDREKTRSLKAVPRLSALPMPGPATRASARGAWAEVSWKRPSLTLDLKDSPCKGQKHVHGDLRMQYSARVEHVCQA